MKLYEILDAREPLAKLLDKKFTNFKTVRELATLRKKVETEVEFYLEQEKKLIETYAERDKAGKPVILENGRVQLKDVESKTAFEDEITSLRSLEVDGIQPVKLKESDFNDRGDIPTPNEWLCLESIISFEEQENLQ